MNRRQFVFASASSALLTGTTFANDSVAMDPAFENPSNQPTTHCDRNIISYRRQGSSEIRARLVSSATSFMYFFTAALGDEAGNMPSVQTSFTGTTCRLHSVPLKMAMTHMEPLPVGSCLAAKVRALSIPA